MARRGGLVVAIIRDIERGARRAAAERRRQEAAQRRAALQAERSRRRLEAMEEKEQKRIYLESRLEDVDNLNQEMGESISALNTILEHTLDIDDTIDFNSLRIHKKFPRFKAPAKLAEPLHKPSLDVFTDKIKQPNVISGALPWVKNKYQKALESANLEYAEVLAIYEKQEADRQAELKSLQKQYERDKEAFNAKVKQRNLEVDNLRDSYMQGDPDSVIAYNTMVLERSSYPDGFPQNLKIAYQSDSKQLIIEYQLPDISVIPTTSEYSYVKSKDEIKEKARKLTEIKNLYQDVIAAMTLRTIHEVIEADQGNLIDVVVFNGYVETIDPSTGKDISPYLISVRATKDSFEQLVLDKVDKVVCLRNLGAQVSPKMSEKAPVRPLVEFKMVDRRFVDNDDVLDVLDDRPNIMDLNPFEFEHLVTNVFNNIGFEAKLTRSSKDGGVDCVAFDNRPILGGKVVIQAKRWSNVVGVSAVRDLYGTMMNEGASKGILVTTSHYGPDAYEFASNKPIELIDGGGLLFLLEEAGSKARIILTEK